jgi:hypothetical protein
VSDVGMRASLHNSTRYMRVSWRVQGAGSADVPHHGQRAAVQTSTRYMRVSWRVQGAGSADVPDHGQRAAVQTSTRYMRVSWRVQGAGSADVPDHGQRAAVQTATRGAQTRGVSEWRSAGLSAQHAHLVAAQVRYLGTRDTRCALRLLCPLRPHGGCLKFGFMFAYIMFIG